MPPTLLAAEKEEAKSVLSFFLKKQGLSKVVAAKTITKSDLLIDHLVSRLHSVHKSRCLVGSIAICTGRELTTPEIRDILIPYIESLLVEHGNSVSVNAIQPRGNPEKPKGVSNAPVREKAAASVSQSFSAPLDSKKPKVGDLRPQFLYLLELGMDLEQIKIITRRYPDFDYCSLERKIKPVVEFLLDLGVRKSDIP
ncbi:transcription termination factor MTERF5, chloroplastic-like [Pistacia vera]|uniref:transcription termination factor MTERF5, chloroplastic-like n=1 Tax=Pistacia vera TaxID=55513 RepID=UPI0012639A4C|nr:transcription termination factor MTERF5, chloroplastic-like [Pistacia vera]